MPPRTRTARAAGAGRDVTSSHVFFIPGMILIGLFIGFILGTRAARNQFDLQQKRQADREAARAARAASRAANPAEEPSQPTS